MVDGKAVHQRPAYYNLIKFAVEKEAEINFDKAKKTRDLTLKPKATTYFCFNSKKSTLPATPAVQMVAPVPEEGSGEREATPSPVKRVTVVNLMKPYTKMQPSLKATLRLLPQVAQASETFTGQCFRCNKVGHRFHDEEYEMYDTKFLNASQRPAKTSNSRQAPRTKGPSKTMGMRMTH